MQDKIFLFPPEHNSVVILDPPSLQERYGRAGTIWNLRRLELLLGIV